MDTTATATASRADHRPRPGRDCRRAAVEVVEQDLLVEDVSIDGMCGVY